MVRRPALTLVLLPLALGLTGCTRDGKFQAISMWNESRIKPYEAGQGTGRDAGLRQIPVGTVPRGELLADSGRSSDNKLLTEFPMPVTKAVLQRGQERFNVYCSPCHGLTGDGQGVVAKRGFPRPPDYAIKRLREAPVGHYYEVITKGYGIMYSYADRVPRSDRWAITAYIRALQAARKEVPEDKWELERVRARELGVPRRGGTMAPTHGAPVEQGAPGEHGAPAENGAPVEHGAPTQGESHGHG
ncbi:MAG: c-type cytochrome [Actinomycetota bacterium]